MCFKVHGVRLLAAHIETFSPVRKFKPSLSTLGYEYLFLFKSTSVNIIIACQSRKKCISNVLINAKRYSFDLNFAS